jgi:quercetin dioxygenase-like cupin family protein
MTSMPIQRMIDEFNALAPADRIQQLETVESNLRAIVQDKPDAEYPNTARHYFSGNLYAREFFLAKGALCLGRVHKFDHIAVVAKGDVSVIGADGWVRLQAGAILESKAGSQRLVFGHEDTLFVTIHDATRAADGSRGDDDPKKMMDALTCENRREFMRWLSEVEGACRLSQSA